MKMGVMDPVLLGACPCDMCPYGRASFLQTNLLIGSDGSREDLKETGRRFEGMRLATYIHLAAVPRPSEN
jgi:hypothetical protein